MPRRYCEFDGSLISDAQSSGECPGSSCTFRVGLEAGGNVEDEAATFSAPIDWFLDPRKDEAAEGGGLRELVVVGSGRNAEGLTPGGGMRDAVAGFRGGSIAGRAPVRVCGRHDAVREGASTGSTALCDGLPSETGIMEGAVHDEDITSRGDRSGSVAADNCSTGSSGIEEGISWSVP